MKLSHVKIRNVLGIEALDFDAGRMVRIEGDNAAGKSSILAAIKGALGGGNQAELIRSGATSAEVVLVFDSGHELRMTSGPKGTVRTIKTPDGIKGAAAQSWIEARLNPLSFNPVAFLQATNEQRIEQLLKVAKLSLKAQDIHIATANIETVEMPEVPNDGNQLVSDPLAALAATSRRIYDHRTGLPELAVLTHYPIPA